MKKTAYSFLGFSFLTALAVLALRRPDVSVIKIKEKLATKHSKFMKIQGMEVHYTDEGSGFPLLLIRGISSSLTTWNGWEENLKEDFRIIRLDLPGFGLTGPNPEQDYSIDFYTSFIKIFLAELDIDSCHIAGSSLGGYITWHMAATYPEMVKKMILLDAAGYPFTPETTPLVFKIAQSRTAKLFKNMTPRFLLTQVMQQVYGDVSKLTEEAIDRYYYNALREGNRDVVLEIAQNIKFTQYHKLKNIKTPALIMWGELDTWVKPALARRFNTDLVNSKLIMYSGVGHIPMEEIPEQTAQDAKQYLLEDLIITKKSVAPL